MKKIVEDIAFISVVLIAFVYTNHESIPFLNEYIVNVNKGCKGCIIQRVEVDEVKSDSEWLFMDANLVKFQTEKIDIRDINIFKTQLANSILHRVNFESTRLMHSKVSYSGIVEANFGELKVQLSTLESLKVGGI